MPLTRVSAHSRLLAALDLKKALFRILALSPFTRHHGPSHSPSGRLPVFTGDIRSCIRCRTLGSRRLEV